jgi:hypothetical protein
MMPATKNIIVEKSPVFWRIIGKIVAQGRPALMRNRYRVLSRDHIQVLDARLMPCAQHNRKF